MNVTPIQRGDKKLNCKDIILEINETEHYRAQAVKERRISAGEAVLPMCWVTGLLDSDKAIASADARIEYLGNIYDLLECGGSTRVPIAVPQGAVPKAAAPQTAPRAAPQAPPVAARSGSLGRAPQANPSASSRPSTQSNATSPNYDTNAHQHRRSDGSVYTHSHPFEGAHRHANGTQ